MGPIAKMMDMKVDIGFLKRQRRLRKEEEWKKTHAANVRKEKSEQLTESKDESDLWQRLEELEVQEALEREWDEQEEEEEDESEEYEETDEEESDITTDNISSDSDND